MKTILTGEMWADLSGNERHVLVLVLIQRWLLMTVQDNYTADDVAPDNVGSGVHSIEDLMKSLKMEMQMLRESVDF